MSTSLPKSESTTSLLRSSAVNRRSAHHSELGSHSHRSHHRYAEGSDVPEESGWTDDCEASARRPLCQPKHAGPRNGDDKRGHKSQPHHHHHRHHHHQRGTVDDGNSQEDRRQRMDRSGKGRSKSTRHPQHQHNTSRGDLPPAPQHGNSRPDRRSSPTPSYPKHPDDTAYFFESKDRTDVGSSTSLNSDPPATSSPVPAVSSRTSKRRSAASSEHDANLHPIVKSVFGQVSSSVSVQIHDF